MTTDARSYKTLTTEEWDSAAELHSKGYTQPEIAERLGCSPRSVFTHLPAAIERRRGELAEHLATLEPETSAPSMTSSKSTTATPSKPSKSAPAASSTMPPVDDVKAATAAWRSNAWSDMALLQTRLRTLAMQTSLMLGRSAPFRPLHPGCAIL